MARKRHKPEEIIAKLRQVEVLTGQGKSIAEAVKTIAVTETTYFRWRAEFGGMKTDHVWTTSKTQEWKRRWRSVECSHVFGLLMQLFALLALMKSADRLPNHVNALEAL